MFFTKETSCNFIYLALSCGSGFTYDDYATGCPATCSNPDAPANCDLPSVEACVCLPGTLLLGDKCVKPEDCGCRDSRGNRYPVWV